METQASIQSEVIAPHTDLVPFVSAYLYNELKIYTPTNVDLFPVGHCVVSFALDNLPLQFKGELVKSKFNITGQLTKHYHMETVPGTYKTIMIVFKPHGSYRLLGIAQNALSDKYTDMLALFPAIEPLYTLIIANAETPHKAVQHIESWLLNRLKTTKSSRKFEEITNLLDEMIERKGNIQLKDVYTKLGMSKSSLERHFKEKIGLNPKLFNRIIRFNEAYKATSSLNFENWQDIVSQFGYFDQAHFIKEFKTFYGFVPSQLHKSKISVAGHVKEFSK
jgi:AraC-like DNA-binding protein